MINIIEQVSSLTTMKPKVKRAHRRQKHDPAYFQIVHGPSISSTSCSSPLGPPINITNRLASGARMATPPTELHLQVQLYPMDFHISADIYDSSMTLPDAATLFQDPMVMPLFEDFSEQREKASTEKEKDLPVLDDGSRSFFSRELQQRPHKKKKWDSDLVSTKLMNVRPSISPLAVEDLYSWFEKSLSSQEDFDSVPVAASVTAGNESLFDEPDEIACALTIVQGDRVVSESLEKSGLTTSLFANGGVTHRIDVLLDENNYVAFSPNYENAAAMSADPCDTVSDSWENLSLANLLFDLLDDEDCNRKPPPSPGKQSWPRRSFSPYPAPVVHSPRFQPKIDEDKEWKQFFQELCQYKKVHGHVNVPQNHQENPSLARWIKELRKRYRLHKEGRVKAFPFPDALVEALQDIGFKWDKHSDVWKERLSELKAYKDIYNSCEVPCRFPENPQLAIWVKHQRRQYRLYKEGRPTSMTDYRIRELEALGFVWVLRNYKNRGPKHPSP